jgi:esterase/lipase superfamily enzyme
MRRVCRNIASVSLTALLAGCTTPYNDAYFVHSVWRPADGINAPWDVFYVTDRNHDRNMPGGFGYTRSADLSCGVMHTAVPAAKLPNSKDVFAKNDGTNSLSCGTGANAVVGAIAKAAHAKNCASVLIYIHGFDTGFETAVLRAAQMASDTQWHCVAAAFSWSSTGKRDTYDQDSANVEAAVPEFAALLSALAKSGLRADIVAHSIGTKLTLSALGATTGQSADQVVMAAPDIGVSSDNDEFAALDRAASSHFEHLTIYASREDAALAISRRLNNGVPRLGRDPRAAYRENAERTDVIDASDAPGDVWGHNYFNFSYEMLADMALALADVPAQARLQPRAGADATLLPGDNGMAYRLNVASSREPDIFTRFLRWLVSAIAG